jgi:hypothetical protein
VPVPPVFTLGARDVPRSGVGVEDDSHVGMPLLRHCPRLQNNVESQSVPHLHLHVIPRTKGDGLRGFLWPRLRYDSPEEMGEYAARLRSALAD